MPNAEIFGIQHLAFGICWVLLCGPIAQRLEPPAHNRPVPGSNPGGPTLRLHGLASKLRWASPLSEAKVPSEAAQPRRRASYGWQAREGCCGLKTKADMHSKTWKPTTRHQPEANNGSLNQPRCANAGAFFMSARLGEGEHHERCPRTADRVTETRFLRSRRRASARRRTGATGRAGCAPRNGPPAGRVGEAATRRQSVRQARR